MRKLTTLSLVAIMAALTIAPAQAQYNYNHNRNNSGFGYRNDINATQARLSSRISRGVADGRLSQREETRLRGKLSQIADIEARMRSSGNRLNFRERQRLQSQLASLANDINRQMNDFERRRIGYWNHSRWF